MLPGPISNVNYFRFGWLSRSATPRASKNLLALHRGGKSTLTKACSVAVLAPGPKSERRRSIAAGPLPAPITLSLMRRGRRDPKD